MINPDNLRLSIRGATLADEATLLHHLITTAALNGTDRRMITDSAVDLVKQVRSRGATTMMENFLGEYGLSTSEGIALMCLAVVCDDGPYLSPIRHTHA